MSNEDKKMKIIEESPEVIFDRMLDSLGGHLTSKQKEVVKESKRKLEGSGIPFVLFVKVEKEGFWTFLNLSEQNEDEKGVTNNVNRFLFDAANLGKKFFKGFLLKWVIEEDGKEDKDFFIKEKE